MEPDVADAKPISPLMRRCRQVVNSTSRMVVLTHNGASVKDALVVVVAEFVFVDILECFLYMS